MSLITTNTKGLKEKDWQKLRRSFSSKGFIGGSDAGTLLGWNKWASPITLYYNAIGADILDKKMNMEMLMGKMQEENIKEMWQYWDEDDDVFSSNVINNKRPRRFINHKATYQNTNYPYLFVNIDGEITKHPLKKNEPGVLEAKKINGFVSDSYYEGIPPQYIAQINHCMMVMGWEYAELVMRVDGRKLVVKMFERDEFVCRAISEAAKEHHDRVLEAKSVLKYCEFGSEKWYEHASRFEPSADATSEFNSFMSAKHKLRKSEKTVSASDEDMSLIDAYVNAKKQYDDAEKNKQFYQNSIKQRMEKAGASVMSFDGGQVSWRKQFVITKK